MQGDNMAEIIHNLSPEGAERMSVFADQDQRELLKQKYESLKKISDGYFGNVEADTATINAYNEWQAYEEAHKIDADNLKAIHKSMDEYHVAKGEPIEQEEPKQPRTLQEYTDAHREYVDSKMKRLDELMHRPPLTEEEKRQQQIDAYHNSVMDHSKDKAERNKRLMELSSKESEEHLKNIPVSAEDAAKNKRDMEFLRSFKPQQKRDPDQEIANTIYERQQAILHPEGK